MFPDVVSAATYLDGDALEVVMLGALLLLSGSKCGIIICRWWTGKERLSECGEIAPWLLVRLGVLEVVETS